MLLRSRGIRINDDTIRHVTNDIGRIVFDKLMKDAEYDYGILDDPKRAPADPFSGPGILYIMCDGAAVNTRTRNDDGSSWRENKLGIVFTSDDLHTYATAKGGKETRLTERMYCSYLGSVDEFRKLLFSTACKKGYMKYKETVFISDGAKWIANMVAEDYPDAVHILDFFHLKENIYSYAKAKFNLDESKYKPWADELTTLIHDGKVDEALGRLDPDERYVNTVDLHGYLTLHHDHVDYPFYKEKGYFIGSGAIESGNKIVLQERLKRAGMRWGTFSAQAMLTLKAMECSGLWLEVEKIVHDFFGI